MWNEQPYHIYIFCCYHRSGHGYRALAANVSVALYDIDNHFFHESLIASWKTTWMNGFFNIFSVMNYNVFNQRTDDLIKQQLHIVSSPSFLIRWNYFVENLSFLYWDITALLEVPPILQPLFLILYVQWYRKSTVECSIRFQNFIAGLASAIYFQQVCFHSGKALSSALRSVWRNAELHLPWQLRRFCWIVSRVLS